MKKLLFIVLVVAATTNVKSQNNWTLGVISSSIGNPSHFSGGSSNASALFKNDMFHGMSLGVAGRYFMGKHISFQSSISISRIGFEYSLAKDYSLTKPWKHYVTNREGISCIQFPLTAIYTTKPNCMNIRLYGGAGINLMSHLHSINKTKEAVPATSEGVPNTDYLNQTVTANSFVAPAAQLVWGIEKLFKRGSILQLGFVANKGFTNIATSTVTYSVNNTVYSHTFTDKGNYLGMTLNYYLKPLSKK